MENPQPILPAQLNPINIGELKPLSISETNESIFSSKNFVIIFLLVVLTFSLLGINLFKLVGDVFDNVVTILKPVVSQSVSIFSSSTGTLINTGADTIEDAAKITGEVASGSLHSLGNLLIKSSNNINIENTTSPPTTKLDVAVNTSAPEQTEGPVPNETTSPIQTTIPASKSNWCLVGDYKNTRGCVKMADHDKCMSGQIYPSQSVCLNPTISQNNNP